jgi:hypothetical protein
MCVCPCEQVETLVNAGVKVADVSCGQRHTLALGSDGVVRHRQHCRSASCAAMRLRGCVLVDLPFHLVVEGGVWAVWCRVFTTRAPEGGVELYVALSCMWR